MSRLGLKTKETEVEEIIKIVKNRNVEKERTDAAMQGIRVAIAASEDDHTNTLGEVGAMANYTFARLWLQMIEEGKSLEEVQEKGARLLARWLLTFISGMVICVQKELQEMTAEIVLSGFEKLSKMMEETNEENEPGTDQGSEA